MLLEIIVYFLGFDELGADIVIVGLVDVGGFRDVGQWVLNNRVEQNNDRKLNEKGKTSRERAITLLLLQLHNLLLLLLHSGLVGPALVLRLDKLHFRRELRHFNLIFLLFYGEGKKYYLEYQRIEQERERIRACDGVEKSHHRAQRGIKPIKHLIILCFFIRVGCVLVLFFSPAAVFGNGVIARATKWIAAQNPPYRKPKAYEKAPLLKCLDSVRRAAWSKTAAGWLQGRNKFSV